MEFNTSPDYQGIIINEDSHNKQPYMYISVFSWLILLICGWISFAVPDISIYGYKQFFFWNYQIIQTNKIIIPYPLCIHYVVFYIIDIAILLSITVAFVVILYIIYIKQDSKCLNGIFGFASKFQFIPLLCVSALFIIGESVQKNNKMKEYFPFKGIHYFFNLLFSIMALITLTFITSQTEIDSPSYVAWIVKHGAFSCIIALLIHNMGYIISNYILYVKYQDMFEEQGEVDREYTEQEVEKWEKGSYIAFSIIIGLGNMAASLILKEVVISMMNILIYIGMMVQFYKLNKHYKKDVYKKAPGIIEAFIIFFSLVIAVFLFIRNRRRPIL